MDTGSNAPGTRPVNFVFCSGDAQPLKLDGTDRRFWIVDAAKAVPVTQTQGEVWDAVLDRQQAWMSRREAVAAAGLPPEPHPSRSAPLCSDCRHISTSGDSYMSFDMCNHPSTSRCPVTGTADLMATSARKPGRHCGPMGALFQPSGAADAAQGFIDDWLTQRIPLPLTPCTTEQLYRAFRHWCDRTSVRWPPTQATFGTRVQKLTTTPTLVLEVRRFMLVDGRKTMRLWLPAVSTTADILNDNDSLLGQMAAFEQALAAYLGQPGATRA